ncbi:MAG TPA: transcriptional repressor LexA [Chthoniobacteraceae bacterium]|nr:transcriptional repressor LexA [Chthoniobacteraceae bacterium]
MLTRRQQEILDYLQMEMNRSGIMPSTREIQQHFRFASQTGAVNHLKALERKGAIQRLAGKARAVALPSMINREPVVDIPMYGSIAAGMPETLDQVAEGRMTIDAATLGVRKGAQTFGLRVRGESMIDAHIIDGDIAILEAREPRHGDIVAALIDGETTLKRYLVERGVPFLRAENERYADLIPATELVIQGVLIGILRGRDQVNRAAR